jgi:hypothetical protein
MVFDPVPNLSKVHLQEGAIRQILCHQHPLLGLLLLRLNHILKSYSHSIFSAVGRYEHSNMRISSMLLYQ